MAQQEIVQLVDDLDGGPAQETVSFGLDGRGFEIDLSTTNATALRGLLADYVARARRITGGRATRTRGGQPRSARRAEDLRAIREWARAQGFEVADRGRVRAEVLAAYQDGAQTVARLAPVQRDNATGESADPRSAEEVEEAEEAEDTADEQPSGEPTDEQVLAWHEAKGYKIPANRKVNGLMRHRYHTAHAAS